LNDDDPDLNFSNENNNDIFYHYRGVEIATLTKQNQSITFSDHIVMLKDHITNNQINACLIPSGYSTIDIDAVIYFGDKKVVKTYIWSRVILKPMALHDMNPGAFETLQ
jgi:hypothetical protein